MSDSPQSPEPSPRPHVRVVALAALVLGACTFPAPARAGWWEELGVPQPVSLADVRKQPDTWRDVPVLLQARFAGARRVGNPYFTQFTPASWRAFATWSETTPEAGRTDESAFARLFVRRGGATDRRAASLEPGARIALHAVVRDSVRGEPWIEVLEITGDGDSLNALEQAELALADRFLAKRNPEAAERRYRTLLKGRALPTEDQASVLRRLGAACSAQEKWDAAVAVFERAVQLAPDDALTLEKLAAARAKVAITAPDRAPDRAAVAAPVAAPTETPGPRPTTPLRSGAERPPLAPPGPDASSGSDRPPPPGAAPGPTAPGRSRAESSGEQPLPVRPTAPPLAPPGGFDDSSPGTGAAKRAADKRASTQPATPAKPTTPAKPAEPDADVKPPVPTTPDRADKPTSDGPPGDQPAADKPRPPKPRATPLPKPKPPVPEEPEEPQPPPLVDPR